jgi:hypothetical protein
MVIWTLHAIPNAYYRFCNPYKGEHFLTATKDALIYPVRKGANVVANLYRKLLNKEEIGMPAETRPRVRSIPRIGTATLMSAWALTGLLNVPIAGDSFNYLVAEPVATTPRLLLTVTFNGITGQGFGLSHAKMLCSMPSKEPGDDIYDTICGDKGTNEISDESNNTPFISRDTLLNNFWSFATGRGPHDPARVVGPIKPNANECDIIYYGSRLRLAKWLSFKPEALSYACRAPQP